MIAVELRRLTGDDLEAIERTERASYPTPWSRTMFAGEIAKSSSICLGAVDVAADLLVGHLIVSRYVDAWHVMNLAVRPAYRRLGIASDLLQELFRLTARDQDRGYTLEVRVSNAAAIRLYEQHGFRSHGLRRGYYTDNREDAIVMWRHPVDGGDPVA